MFDPREAARKIIEDIRDTLKGVDDCIVAAVSGGVDSTTASALTYLALGDRVHPIFIDTGFMRKNEPQLVRESLRDIMPLEIYNYSERFYSELLNKDDAEVKRKIFREVFYRVLDEVLAKLECGYMVQGTIAPDWIETLGGIKTQHNIIGDLNIFRRRVKVIEPLRNLYKDQVRLIAREIGLPEKIWRRQPFPGPGLLIRTVGRLELDKLNIVREATDIVEEILREYSPSQYFAAAWEDAYLDNGVASLDSGIEYRVFKARATGVRGDSRVYSHMVLVTGLSGSHDLYDLYSLYKRFEDKPYSRSILNIAPSEHGDGQGYFISIRSVDTVDFMTAEVTRIDMGVLEEISERLLRIKGVAGVGFDITPKPPATIEYE